jgi:hypothetical protein
VESVTAETSESFEIDDPDMYGIEQVLAKKLGFPLGHAVIRGALVRDHAAGRTYFVTDADLVRYRKPPEVPDVNT